MPANSYAWHKAHACWLKTLILISGCHWGLGPWIFLAAVSMNPTGYFHRKQRENWTKKSLELCSYSLPTIFFWQLEILATAMPYVSGMYMLWFSFILGSNFIFLCFKLIIIHYHTQKQRKIKFKPKTKLNHNIYLGCQWVKSCLTLIACLILFVSFSTILLITVSFFL